MMMARTLQLIAAARVMENMEIHIVTSMAQCEGNSLLICLFRQQDMREQGDTLHSSAVRPFCTHLGQTIIPSLGTRQPRTNNWADISAVDVSIGNVSLVSLQTSHSTTIILDTVIAAFPLSCARQICGTTIGTIKAE
jgi:hypothetical protein